MSFLGLRSRYAQLERSLELLSSLLPEDSIDAALKHGGDWDYTNTDAVDITLEVGRLEGGRPRRRGWAYQY